MKMYHNASYLDNNRPTIFMRTGIAPDKDVARWETITLWTSKHFEICCAKFCTLFSLAALKFGEIGTKNYFGGV